MNLDGLVHLAEGRRGGRWQTNSDEPPVLKWWIMEWLQGHCDSSQNGFTWITVSIQMRRIPVAVGVSSAIWFRKKHYLSHLCRTYRNKWDDDLVKELHVICHFCHLCVNTTISEKKCKTCRKRKKTKQPKTKSSSWKLCQDSHLLKVRLLPLSQGTNQWINQSKNHG